MPGDSFSGVVLAGVSFLIIIGYSNILAQKSPNPVDTTFWISTIVFYIACSTFVVIRSYDRFSGSMERNFTGFRDAFIPHFEPYLALGAVGGLTFLALTIWMPVASILSLIVFANLWCQRRNVAHRSKEAEQVMTPNGS